MGCRPILEKVNRLESGKQGRRSDRGIQYVDGGDFVKRFIAVLLLAVLLISGAAADSVFVLCQPNSFVYVREFPKQGAEVAGRVELGGELETDGRRKNGYVHVLDFEGGAWINAGFVTTSPVEIRTIETEVNSTGRVACRRSIKGTRRKWLSNGQKVVIYAFDGDWAVTNQGFIRMRYLGVF
jgi:hypothetical protein